MLLYADRTQGIFRTFKIILFCPPAKKLLTEALLNVSIFIEKGVTVKQRFASVNRSSKKQPNFGRSGCFFDVFYFFQFARY